MSRRNKHKHAGPKTYQPGETIRYPNPPPPEDPNAATATVLSYYDGPTLTALEDSIAETKILPRDIYRAEEIQFPVRYGNILGIAEVNHYINTFARENDAALLQFHPTSQPGQYLFIWDMT